MHTMSEDTLEQRIVDYLYMTAALPADLQPEATDSLAVRAEGSEALADICLGYLGNYDSPMRNVDLLQRTLASLCTLGGYHGTDLERLQMLLEETSRNMPGDHAADLHLLLEDGSEAMLSELTSRADTTIVVFYDADCRECMAMLSALAASPKGEGAVVAVRMGATHSPMLRDAWIRAALPGEGEEARERYYLSTLPAVYALTRENIVAWRR